jgi:hypothetical protein
MSAPALPSSDSLRPDEQPLAEYVAVSRPAIAALALGLASPLVLVSPLLIVVPLAGLAVAAFALRQSAASGGQLKGTWPATIGLCLATLFLGWGATQQFSRQAILSEQAERFASGWLALVREGRLQEADQLMRPGGERIRHAAALAEHYKENPEAGENLQATFAGDPLKAFRELGKAATYQLDGIAAQSRNGDSDEIVLEFVFEAPGGSGPRSMWITVARHASEEASRPADWQVRRVEAFPPQGQ